MKIECWEPVFVSDLAVVEYTGPTTADVVASKRVTVKTLSGESEAESHQFELTWTPLGPIAHTGLGTLQMHVTASPALGSTILVDLQGGTSAPKLTVTPTEFDLGSLRPGGVATATAHVRNDGDAVLLINEITLDCGLGFSLGGSKSASLKPGETSTWTLDFENPPPGMPAANRSCVLAFMTNVPDLPRQKFHVRAATWSAERCVPMVVDGPWQDDGLGAPGLVSGGRAVLTGRVRNVGDGPCRDVSLLLLAGPPSRDALTLPAPCDGEQGAHFERLAFDQVDTLAPNESTLLTATFAAPHVAGTLLKPIGLRALAGDPGMPVGLDLTSPVISADPSSGCDVEWRVAQQGLVVATMSGAMELVEPDDECDTTHHIVIGGIGELCAVQLSPSCAGDIVLESPVPSAYPGQCSPVTMDVGAGVPLTLRRFDDGPSAGCQLEVVEAGDPPRTSIVEVKSVEGTFIDGQKCSGASRILIVRGPLAPTAATELGVHLDSFIEALPDGAKIAFADYALGYGFHAPDGGAAALTVPEHEATVKARAETWRSTAEASESTPSPWGNDAQERLARILGATAWLLPTSAPLVGHGCTADDQCPNPLRCEPAQADLDRRCVGPSTVLVDAPGMLIQVIWIGDAGPATSDVAPFLDQLQQSGVLRQHHVVFHHVRAEPDGCTPIPPGGQPGTRLLTELTLETGGTTIDICGGVTAWQKLASVVAKELVSFRLRFPYKPGTLVSPLSDKWFYDWWVSPSGRTTRPLRTQSCRTEQGIPAMYELGCTE